MNPVTAALTVVEPEVNGWNATPPVVVSVGELACPIGIAAVCVTPGEDPVFSSSPTPSGGTVNVTVSGPGAPARTFWSWLSAVLLEFAIPTRAYAKLAAESVVVDAGMPCRSMAACCDVSIAVPFVNPGAETVTVACTVSVVQGAEGRTTD